MSSDALVLPPALYWSASLARRLNDAAGPDAQHGLIDATVATVILFWTADRNGWSILPDLPADAVRLVAAPPFDGAVNVGEERPHHLWVWFDQCSAWQSAGHGTETEMRAALDITQQARKISRRSPLTLEVAVESPPAPTGSNQDDDPAAAALIADRARAAAVTALALIDPTEDPEVHAFAAATYAVAAEVHAFRLVFTDELRKIRKEIRR